MKRLAVSFILLAGPALANSSAPPTAPSDPGHHAAGPPAAPPASAPAEPDAHGGAPEHEILVPPSLQLPKPDEITSEDFTLPDPLAAAEAAKHDATHAATAPLPESEHDATQRASLLRIGQAKLDKNDPAAAIVAFRQVAEAHPPEEDAVVSLLGLARAYRMAGESVKAVATYEHLLKTVPVGSHTPTTYFEVGQVLRDMGSPKLALARFYSVIHTTLRLPDATDNSYRRVVQNAQFEIAETHFQIGEYDTAVRLFKRYDLLDIDETERATARFKIARALRLSGQSLASARAFRDFISQYGQDSHAPEAYFELATILDEIKRPEDSLRVTLDLLQIEHAKSGEDMAAWRRWQQRTGMQLAAAYYQRGEFTPALRLYRALTALDKAPAWTTPLRYQEGLCWERLLQFSRAQEAYQDLIATGERTKSPEIEDIMRMAQWRLDQIAWSQKTQSELHALNPVGTSDTVPSS